jgi:hypothetical protein
VTWVPDPPTEEGLDRPWNPKLRSEPGLDKEHARLVYIVIDETVGDWVGLSLAPWPHADERGRLRFIGTASPIEVGTEGDALLEFLKTGSHFDPKAEVRIGSTFAARTRRGTAAKLLESLRDKAGHGEVRIRDLGAILKDPVDLTTKGRRLAQLASFGALLSTVPEKAQEKWQLGDK